MASDRKKNVSLITWVLVAALIAIWGEISLQLFFHRRAETGASMKHASNVAMHDNTMSTHYKFGTKIRDPFSRFAPVDPVQKKARKVSKTVRAWKPPAISLEGVILGDGKRTAILATRDGTTYFLADGDTLKGVKLLKVADTTVAYRYQNKDTSWVLRR